MYYKMYLIEKQKISPDCNMIVSKDVYLDYSIDYIEQYNDATNLNDCRIIMYKYEYDDKNRVGCYKEIGNKLFRYTPDIPEYMKRLKVSIRVELHHSVVKFYITINGIEYTDVEEDWILLSRYKSQVYTENEFVYMFFKNVVNKYLLEKNKDDK